MQDISSTMNLTWESGQEVKQKQDSRIWNYNAIDHALM